MSWKLITFVDQYTITGIRRTFFSHSIHFPKVKQSHSCFNIKDLNYDDEVTLSWQYEWDGGVRNGLCLVATAELVTPGTVPLSWSGLTLFKPTLFVDTKDLSGAFNVGEDSHFSIFPAVAGEFCNIRHLLTISKKQYRTMYQKSRKKKKKLIDKHTLLWEHCWMLKALSLEESANTSTISGIIRFQTVGSLSLTGDIFHVISSPPSSWLCFINYHHNKSLF